MKTETVVISIAATTDVVAGVPNNILRVIHYTIVAAGAVTLSFRSGPTTQLTGSMPLTTGQALVVNVPPRSDDNVCLFQTLPGDPLNINLSGAIGVTGHMIIERVVKVD